MPADYLLQYSSQRFLPKAAHMVDLLVLLHRSNGFQKIYEKFLITEHLLSCDQKN